MSVRSLVFLLAALPLKAATVRLYLSGVITEENLTGIFNPPPSTVGSRWEFEALCSYPTAPTQFMTEDYQYSPILGTVSVKVANLYWSGATFGVAVMSGPSLATQYLTMASSPLTSSDPQFSLGDVSLFFDGPPGITMLHDLSSLPASLSDWDLRLADHFMFTVTRSVVTDGWRIRGNSIDTISIQVIPEPSAAGLAVAVALVMGRRRRRVGCAPCGLVRGLHPA